MSYRDLRGWAVCLAAAGWTLTRELHHGTPCNTICTLFSSKRECYIAYYVLLQYLEITSLQWPVRVNQNFRVSIYPLVELLVRARRIVNVDFMRDDKAWLRFSGDDEVPQVSVVRFHVTLAGA